MRGHAPSFFTPKEIFVNKQDKSRYLSFPSLPKDVFGLLKGSYVVLMKEIVSLIFRCIAVRVAATNPKINATLSFNKHLSCLLKNSIHLVEATERWKIQSCLVY